MFTVLFSFFNLFVTLFTSVSIQPKSALDTELFHPSLSRRSLIEQYIRSLFEILRPKSASPTQTTNPHNRVSDIDGDVEAYKAIIRTIEERIAACQTRRNAVASPINNLPQDVVGAILLHAIPHDHDYHRNLTTLRLVCKAWSEYINASPLFWTQMFSHNSMAYLDKVVQRARGAPVAVKHAPKPGYPSKQYPKLLQRLASGTWPIGVFRFKEYEQLKEDALAKFKTFLEAPAPHMKSLQIYSQHYEVERAHIVIDNLLGGDAPELESLFLRNVAVRWDKVSLPNLRTLVLEGLQGPSAHLLSMEGLVSLLERCPSLETLVVRDMAFASSDPLAPAPPTITSLGQLQNFTLKVTSPYFACDVLRRVRLPRCTNLAVSVTGASLPPHTAELVETMMEITPAAKDVDIHFVGCDGMEISGGHWKLSMDAVLAPSSGVDGWKRLLVDSLPLVARQKVFSFHVTHPSSEPTNLDILLPIVDLAFPELVELSMVVQEGFKLDILSQPNHHAKWLFPNLKTFVLNDEAGHTLGRDRLSEVIRMADARRSPQLLEGREVAAAPLATFKTPARMVERLSEAAIGLYETLQAAFDTVQHAPGSGNWTPTGENDMGVVFHWVPEPQARRVGDRGRYFFDN